MKTTKTMHQLTKNQNGSYSITAYKTRLVNEKIEREVVEQMTVSPEEVGEALMFSGVSFDDIRFAVEEMEANGHDSASFGVNGGFVFSFNEEKTFH